MSGLLCVQPKFSTCDDYIKHIHPLCIIQSKKSYKQLLALALRSQGLFVDIQCDPIKIVSVKKAEKAETG